jgi:cyclic beta-1,2-glucan synthetase
MSAHVSRERGGDTVRGGMRLRVRGKCFGRELSMCSQGMAYQVVAHAQAQLRAVKTILEREVSEEENQQQKTELLVQLDEVFAKIDGLKQLRAASIVCNEQSPNRRRIAGIRIVLLASDYLEAVGCRVTDVSVSSYLAGVEDYVSSTEVAQIVVALQLAVLLDMSAAHTKCATEHVALLRAKVQRAMAILTNISDLDPEHIARLCLDYETFLEKDPAQVYEKLDSYSKRSYRAAVEALARRSGCTARHVCEVALALARASGRESTALQDDVHKHVGYYFIDDGRARLAAELRIPHWGSKVYKRDMVRFGSFCAINIVCTVAVMTVVVGSLCPAFHCRALGVICFTAAIAPLSSSCVTWLMLCGARILVKPMTLPRLNESWVRASGMPIVLVVPTLLLSAEHVMTVIERLKRNYVHAEYPNVLVTLVTAFPDCYDGAPPSEREQRVLMLCSTMIQDLNHTVAAPGRAPFMLLHRARAWCGTERCWTGRERKRGAYEAVVAYIMWGTRTFSYHVGELEQLREVKYSLLLDDDVEITPSSVCGLLGICLHPLNRASVDERTKTLRHGYGIFQPSILATTPRESKATEISEARDLYQDIFGEAISYGSCLIDVHSYSRVVFQRIPEECYLYHEIIESGLLRTVAVPSVFLVAPQPSSYLKWCKRKHRWIRCHWQNVRWLGRSSQNNALSWPVRYRMLEHIIGSLLPVSTMIALVVSSLIDPYAFLWLLGTLLLVDIVVRAPGARVRGEALSLTLGLVNTARLFCFKVVIVAHTSALSVDAIIRTCVRMMLGQRLLEWEVSAVDESAPTSGGIVKAYDNVSSACAGLSVAILVISQRANAMVCILLLLWTCAPLLRGALLPGGGAKGRS